jgi:hypothetical protein
MKRIINGTTYNTDTASMIADGTWEDENRGTTVETTLYESRSGVYFAVANAAQTYRDRHNDLQTCKWFEWTVVGNADKARAYAEKEQLTIHRDMMPPEAGAGNEVSALYVRLTPTIRRHIDEAAAAAKLSANAWAVRCLEHGLKP